MSCGSTPQNSGSGISTRSPCSSLASDAAQALQQTDHFLVCVGGCTKRRTLTSAVEGGTCDAGLVLRGGKIKVNEFDQVFFTDPNDVAQYKQVPTTIGIVAMTGQPTGSAGFTCKSNYHPMVGYTVPKKQLYHIEAAVQIELNPPVMGSTKNKLMVAIRQNGTKVSCSHLEQEILNPVTAVVTTQTVHVKHVGIYEVGDLIDVFIQLSSDPGVNTDVVSAVRTLHIKGQS